MNRLVRLLIVALLAGGGAFWLTRQLAPTPSPTGGSELTWLANEFDLDPAQAERIAALHAAYEPVCAAHCAAILDTRAALAAAADETARRATAAELKDLVATCQESTRAHLEAVAAVMDPAQGRRYLDLIEPRLSSHEHAQPFGLR